jgi:hypothetical protein
MIKLQRKKQSVYESQQKELSRVEQELDNLGRMLYRGQVDEIFYNKEKVDLESQKKKLRSNIDGTETFADDWREVSSRAFNFLTNASKCLKNASQEDKKTILSAIAQKVTARDKKITITPYEWISTVRTLKENLDEVDTRVRTDNSLLIQDENTISQKFSLVLRLVYDIGTSLMKDPVSRYVIPRIQPESGTEREYSVYLPYKVLHKSN